MDFICPMAGSRSFTTGRKSRRRGTEEAVVDRGVSHHGFLHATALNTTTTNLLTNYNGDTTSNDATTDATTNACATNACDTATANVGAAAPIAIAVAFDTSTVASIRVSITGRAGNCNTSVTSRVIGGVLRTRSDRISNRSNTAVASNTVGGTTRDYVGRTGNITITPARTDGTRAIIPSNLAARRIRSSIIRLNSVAPSRAGSFSIIIINTNTTNIPTTN